MQKAIIEKKFTKSAGQYMLIIPKTLIDCKVIDPKKAYKVVIEEIEAFLGLCSRYQRGVCYG